jgi:GNAT superfamily N-acetyltransferase
MDAWRREIEMPMPSHEQRGRYLTGIAMESDQYRIGSLEKAGFMATPHHAPVYFWDLSRTLPEPSPPAGTRPEWRGTGAGRAVIHEGLRRLRDAGMRWERVSTAGFNHPAQALYRSCGFERVETERTFIRKLD